MQSSQEALRKVGLVSLFLGIETYTWDIAQFQQVAQFAQAQGIQTLIVKVADGAVPWHGGLGNIKAIQAAMRQQGVEMLPYLYAYGDRYHALDDELKIIRNYLETFGSLCIQLEEEWNGQVAWAESLASHLQDQEGALFVSCLADPIAQNQQEVLQTLAPVVSVWMPQVYTDSLQASWQSQFSEFDLHGFCVTYHLSEDFGANQVQASLVANQDLSPHVSLWDYHQAIDQETLLATIVSSVVAWEQSKQAQSQQEQEEEEEVSIDSNTPIIQEHFEVIGTGWQVKNALDANGDPIVLRGSILEYYCNEGTRPYGGYSSVGLPMTNELPVERFGTQYTKLAQKGIVIVFFERGVWIYDPQHLVDAPYGAGAVYPLKLYDNGLGRDPSINKLNADLLTMQQQLQQAQQNNTPLTILHQIKALLMPVL